MISEKKKGTWISGPCIKLKMISAAAATLKSSVWPVPMNVVKVTAGSMFGKIYKPAMTKAQPKLIFLSV